MSHLGRSRRRATGELLLIGWLLIGAGCAAAPRASADPPRPNVIFLLGDDHRRDAIAAWGNEHIRTPSLDRLAAAGFSFRNAYCMGSIHGAVCVPSRAMIMSGRTLYRVPMDLAGVPLLPQRLREAGYVTFATGKWHNGEASFLHAFDRGRSVMLGGMSNHLAVPVADVSDDRRLVNGRTERRFSSELFADAAIEFLQRHEEGKPFFLYVSFTAPHDPRMPPEPYRAHYYANPPPLPANFLPQHPFDNGRLVVRDEMLAAWPRTESDVRDQLAEYYGLVTHLDEQIGRVLDALEASGHRERTVVVYAADHGLAVGSHGLLGKQNLYEHSMGAPLIVAGPGVPAGGSSAALVYLHDLFPTICGLAGAAPPDAVEGRDLRPIWQERREGVRDSLFTAYESSQRAVRDGRFKLIRYPLIDHVQLFDLRDDPSELRNLAAEPGHAGRVEAMTRLLERWQRQVGDAQPLSVDHPTPMRIDLSDRARKPDRWQPGWIVEKYFR